jgi:hypothetical protein
MASPSPQDRCMFTSRTSKLAVATVAASLAFVAPAAADSVAYLQGGDVWLTTTDISRQYQVTATGGYTAVSQADDGTLLGTTTAGKLRRIDRNGTVLSEVGTIAGGSSSFSFKGPYDADLSPNGAKLAYGYTYSGYTSDTGGGTWVNEGNATAFAPADHESTSADTGYKSSREYDAPEWVDDQRVLVSNGPGYPSSPLAVVEAGSGGSRSWFTDPENPHPHDATLSRNWRMLAMTNGTRDGLYVYRDDDALLLGGVHPCFYYSPDVGGTRYSSPTFNADGSKLFFADGRGLEVAPIGDTRVACPDGQNSKTVLPGASSPDWGPADVPPARALAQDQGTGSKPGGGTISPQSNGTAPNGQTPPGTSGPGAEPNGRGSQPTAAGATLSLLAGNAKLGKALKSGLTVTITAPASGQVKVSAVVAGKTVASGSTKANAAGLVSVKLRFTAAAKRKFAKRRSVALTITGTQGSASGTAVATLRK